MQVQFRWIESADQSIQEATKAVEKAVTIDARDVWAQTALGLVLYLNCFLLEN